MLLLLLSLQLLALSAHLDAYFVSISPYRASGCDPRAGLTTWKWIGSREYPTDKGGSRQRDLSCSCAPGCAVFLRRVRYQPGPGYKFGRHFLSHSQNTLTIFHLGLYRVPPYARLGTAKRPTCRDDVLSPGLPPWEDIHCGASYVRNVRWVDIY